MPDQQTDNSEIIIRPVNKQDAGFINQLMNCPSILQILNEVPTVLQDWMDAINEWLHDDDEEDYIILEHNTPIGWIGINGLMGQDRTAYIKMAVLLPEYQGRGIGSFAIRNLLQNFKSRGVAKFLLYTDQDNSRAHKCYQKCGFRITETLTETMSNGKEIPRVLMEAIL
ncbi:MAG: GNAT family N-acetyltransferase [Clostridia bacterium]|nr:GNAT family N-acetyltransferase [Clostridia bacterium]